MARITVVATLLLLASPRIGEAGLAPQAGTNPGREAQAELRVYPAVVGITQVPRAVLVNTGDATVVTGYVFKLERKTIVGWEWINEGQAWPLALLFLEPGERTRTQPIGVWRVNPRASERSRSGEPCCVRVLLEPGLYRVTKGAEAAAGVGRPRQLVARATFRVVAPTVSARPHAGVEY
jgi:hypothetical protein